MDPAETLSALLEDGKHDLICDVIGAALLVYGNATPKRIGELRLAVRAIGNYMIMRGKIRDFQEGE